MQSRSKKARAKGHSLPRSGPHFQRIWGRSEREGRRDRRSRSAAPRNIFSMASGSFIINRGCLRAIMGITICATGCWSNFSSNILQYIHRVVLLLGIFENIQIILNNTVHGLLLASQGPGLGSVSCLIPKEPKKSSNGAEPPSPRNWPEISTAVRDGRILRAPFNSPEPTLIVANGPSNAVCLLFVARRFPPSMAPKKKSARYTQAEPWQLGYGPTARQKLTSYGLADR